jgi:hypothetical protein
MRTTTALLLAALAAAPGSAPATPKGPLRFADDYARALAAALARKVPLFVDAWAPW